MRGCRCRLRARACRLRARALLAAVALALAAVAAAGTIDDSNGFVQPSSGPPAWTPGVWNRAYSVSALNVPKAEATPFPLGSISDLGECTRVNGSAPPNLQAAAMGTCFVRERRNATYDLWLKLPGLARENANCYCYGMDYFKGGYCQPGSSGGGAAKKRYTDKLTCAALNDAVAADGGQRVTREQALSGQPPAGHYIAMMARPGPGCIPGPGAHCSGDDYHVLRKDASGQWSGKFPRSPAENTDLFGATITDPEAAAVPGHYEVCGYFRVEPSKMVIGTDGPATGPLTQQLQQTLDNYKSVAAVQLAIAPLPFNAATDALREDLQVKVFAQDAEWERKRGTPEYAAWKQQQRQALELEPAGNGTAAANSDSPAPRAANPANSSGANGAPPAPAASATNRTSNTSPSPSSGNPSSPSRGNPSSSSSPTGSNNPSTTTTTTSSASASATASAGTGLPPVMRLPWANLPLPPFTAGRVRSLGLPEGVQPGDASVVEDAGVVRGRRLLLPRLLSRAHRA